MRQSLCVALLALAACTHPDRDPVHALARARDFRPLIRGGVTNGGLWFADAACAATFATPGPIAPTQQDAFARCLEGLQLQASPRADALGDVVVMNHGPGFEVEARVVQDPAGPRLTWIGPSSQRPDGDTLPTISGEALERLRVAGTPDGPIDEAALPALEGDIAAGYDRAFAWVKVCIDENGAVQTAHAHEATSPRAVAAFVAAARQWAFRPFEVGGRAVPVCALTRLDYPAAKAPVAEILPMPPPPSRGADDPLVLPASSRGGLRRVAGNPMVQPDQGTFARMMHDDVDQVIGSFRICIDTAGAVESALPMRTTGYAAYDNELMTAMRTWRYEPYVLDDHAIPVCSTVTFVYVPGQASSGRQHAP